MTEYSELEKTINSVMLKIGTKNLIAQLRRIEQSNDYLSFEQIKKAICHYFGVLDKNIVRNFKNDDSVNARRTILYFSTIKTSLSADDLMQIMNIKRRTYERYINKISDVKSNPSTDIKLSKAIIEIETIIKNSQNG